MRSTRGLQQSPSGSSSNGWGTKMAKYDFVCPACGDSEEVVVPFRVRDSLEVSCSGCNTLKRRMFPVEAARGMSTFEPYWDEALGVNIYTAEQKAKELKKRGLVEAGDKEGGARLFDKKLPNGSQIGKRPLKDARHDTPMVEVNAEYDDFDVSLVDKAGNSEDMSFSDLEADTPGDPVAAKKAFENLTLKAAREATK